MTKKVTHLVLLLLLLFLVIVSGCGQPATPPDNEEPENNVSRVEVVNLPENYIYGEELNLNNLMVIVYYEDGSTQYYEYDKFEEYVTVTGFDNNKTEEQDVTVSYTVKDNEGKTITSGTKNFTVDVYKEDSEISFNSTFVDYKDYNEQPFEVTSSDYTTNSDGDVVIKWLNSSGDELESAPVLPGNYTLRLEVTNSNRYKDSSVQRSITINKIMVTAPTADKTQFTYDAEIQLPVFEPSELYTVSFENEESKKVGYYRYTISLKDTSIYKWNSGYSSDISGYYNINTRYVNVPEIDKVKLTYTGEELTYPVPESKFYTVTNNKAVNVGRYTLRLEIDEENCAFIDAYNWRYHEYQFDIDKGENVITVVNAPATSRACLEEFESFTEEDVSVLGSDTYVSVGVYRASGSYVYGGDSRYLSVGEYYYLITADESANYKKAELKVPFTITKGQVELTLSTASSSITYGSFATFPEVSCNVYSNYVYCNHNVEDEDIFGTDKSVKPYRTQEQQLFYSKTYTFTYYVRETDDYFGASQTFTLKVNPYKIDATKVDWSEFDDLEWNGIDFRENAKAQFPGNDTRYGVPVKYNCDLRLVDEDADPTEPGTFKVQVISAARNYELTGDIIKTLTVKKQSLDWKEEASRLHFYHNLSKESTTPTDDLYHFGYSCFYNPETANNEDNIMFVYRYYDQYKNAYNKEFFDGKLTITCDDYPTITGTGPYSVTFNFEYDKEHYEIINCPYPDQIRVQLIYYTE